MLTREKLQHHISHLQEKHDDLDRRLQVDNLPEYISKVLKKEKLALKDEIEKITTQLTQLSE